MKTRFLYLCLSIPCVVSFMGKLQTSIRKAKVVLQVAEFVPASGDLSKLKVPELKELLRSRGLKVSGTKSELISRLGQTAVSSEPTVAVAASDYETGATPDSPSSNGRAAFEKVRLLTDEDLLSDRSPEPTNFKELISIAVSSTLRSGRQTAEPSRSLRYGASSAEEFGPTGHDYQRHPDDTSDLSKVTGGMAKIDELLATRLQKKLSKQFRDADALERELGNLGVTVQERPVKLWRADLALGEAMPPRIVPYTKVEVGGGGAPVDEALVSKLVNERVVAKLGKDFNKADRIRNKLEDEFNVILDDRQKTWIVKHPAGHPYVPEDVDEASFVTSELAAINDLLARTYKAKRAGDFDEADAAQEDLRSLYGVSVVDRNGARWCLEEA